MIRETNVEDRQQEQLLAELDYWAREEAYDRG